MGKASFGNGWEGRVVEGKFPLLEWLGGSENCGSFLTVLHGLQEAVIQLILPGVSEADIYLAQWDYAKGLTHPHLAKLFAEGRCVIDGNDLVYVVTERSSATLSKIIQTRRLDADSARETFDPILNALSCLHKGGVVHGYVSPSSIYFVDSKPKLSVTDLLIAGSVKRGVPRPGNYDASELTQGIVTEAADTWSIGMSLCEAMTQAPPLWDPASTKDPEVPESLPSPFREIVQDCLRVDPLRRCTIGNILERLEESKSIPMSDEWIPVKADSPVIDGPADSQVDEATPVRASEVPVTVDSSVIDSAANVATPIEAGEVPIRDEPVAPPSKPEEVRTEESPEPVLFSKSLTHFEETPLSRSRVLPYGAVLLAVVAVIAVLLVRGHRRQTSLAVASQTAPAVTPAAPEKQSAAPAPSVADQTEPATSPPVTTTQPDATLPAETPSTTSPEQTVPPPAQPPASAVDHELAKEKTEGLVAKRVLPTVSPGARAGMRRPIEVVIRVSVNRDGTVSDAAYVSPGPGNYFARLAQRAAQSWKFKPPRRNGDAQRSVWTLRFNFDGEKTEATATQAQS